MIEFYCEIKIRKQKDFKSILKFLNDYYETLDDESLEREILDNSNIWEDDYEEKIIEIEPFETNDENIEKGFEAIVDSIIKKEPAINFTATAAIEFPENGSGKEVLYKFEGGSLERTEKKIEGHFEKYIKFIKEELSFVKFCKLFALQKEFFTEDMYNEFISSTCEKGILKTKYEEFISICSNSTLNKEEYKKILVQLKSKSLVSFEQYLEDYSWGAEDEEYEDEDY